MSAWMASATTRPPILTFPARSSRLGARSTDGWSLTWREGSIGCAHARALVQGYVDQLESGPFPNEKQRAYIHATFDQFGTDGVIASLEAMVRAGTRDEMAAVSLFLQDALMRAYAPEIFSQTYYHSTLLTAIREQLYSLDHAIRHQSIHLLGKRGPRENARYLLAAFPWYVAHDPLNLEGLPFELLWLRPRLGRLVPRKQLIWNLVGAPFFVTRWAAVDLLWEEASRLRRLPVWIRQFLRTLAQDQHPWVRAEARWRLDQLRTRQMHRAVKKRYDDSSQSRWPSPTIPSYSAVAQNVWNYLAVSGEADYNLELVESISRHLVQHPVTPGYDLREYWSALANSRGVSVDRI